MLIRINKSFLLAAQSRTLHTTISQMTIDWRRSMRLPENRTSEGPLTDLPDYTFLDGRPTPLLRKQKMRVLKQREFAASIVQLNSELDFAVEREKKLKEQEAKSREDYLKNRLKPKGKLLDKKY